jgi:hypothetical protein
VFPETRSVLTLLGSGQAGHRDGRPQEARFSEPGGLSLGNGRLYIADTNNYLVRVADLEAGEVWTLEVSGVENSSQILNIGIEEIYINYIARLRGDNVFARDAGHLTIVFKSNW